MAVIVGDGRLTLTGYVGESTLEFDGWVVFDGFTHPEVLAALAEIGDDTDLEVRINSGGGYAYEGAAIRSALAERKGKTTVVVDGVAASAASLIAMAGNPVRMSAGSVMMIHDPAGFTVGTVEDHERQIKALNSLGTSYARVYARKSGKPEADCRELMRLETWFTPEEAVEAGFADQTDEAPAQAVAAFPYQTYAHAPRELVAMARTQGWRSPLPQFAASAAKPPAAKPAASTSQQETPMADQNPAGDKTADADAQRKAAADAVKADRERRAAVMALPEAKGREALAEHLYASTEMTADQIKATLAASPAPKADEQKPETDPAAYEASRLNGAGLGGKAPKASGSDRLVNSMKAMLAKEGK